MSMDRIHTYREGPGHSRIRTSKRLPPIRRTAPRVHDRDRGRDPLKLTPPQTPTVGAVSLDWCTLTEPPSMYVLLPYTDSHRTLNF